MYSLVPTCKGAKSKSCIEQFATLSEIKTQTKQNY
jgi:hypothetical protein